MKRCTTIIISLAVLNTVCCNYNDYAVLTFETSNVGDTSYHFEEPYLLAGKFYDPYDKDVEIGPKEINEKFFNRNQKALIGMCGRKSSLYGVVGGVFLKYNGQIFSELVVKVPYFARNSMRIDRRPGINHRCVLPKYPEKGPIGNVTIRCNMIG